VGSSHAAVGAAEASVRKASGIACMIILQKFTSAEATEQLREAAEKQCATSDWSEDIFWLEAAKDAEWRREPLGPKWGTQVMMCDIVVMLFGTAVTLCGTL
jgi:hypothetical protein